MKLEISKSAFKFIESQDKKTRSRIKDKLIILIRSIEESSIVPYKILDIKSLKGNWRPYKRLRIGNIRIIFTIEHKKNILKIIEIDERGDIYK